MFVKHILVNKEELGIHVSYLYNRRQDYHLNGIAGGITYSPSILPDLKLIVEHPYKIPKIYPDLPEFALSFQEFSSEPSC